MGQKLHRVSSFLLNCNGDERSMNEEAIPTLSTVNFVATGVL